MSKKCATKCYSELKRNQRDYTSGTWRKAWQPTLVFLRGESSWTVEHSYRLQSMGSQRVGRDWVTQHSTAPQVKEKLKHNFSKSTGNRKSNSNKEVYNNTGLSQETNKPNLKEITLTYQLRKFKKKKKRIANKAHSHPKAGHNKDQRRSKYNRDQRQQQRSIKSFLENKIFDKHLAMLIQKNNWYHWDPKMQENTIVLCQSANVTTENKWTQNHTAF